MTDLLAIGIGLLAIAALVGLGLFMFVYPIVFVAFVVVCASWCLGTFILSRAEGPR